MFTGIIESLGIVLKIEIDGGNRHLQVKSSLAPELRVDQSIAHNGVCLTVTKIEGDSYWVTAIDETLKKSNLGHLKVSDRVNLERCVALGSRLDGHMVQGHVDQTGRCEGVKVEDGSWIFDFSYDTTYENLTVEKGSICVNGVSLTCFNSRKGAFSVAIIPYTFEHTTFKNLKAGDTVNLEFDIIGKYVKGWLSQYR